MPNLSESEKAYIAGIVDGEGCVSISKCPKDGYIAYNIKLSIATVDFTLVEWFLKRTDATIYTAKFLSRLSRRPQFKIHFQNMKALSLLREVSKYLVIKKERVEFVLEEYPRRCEQAPEKRNFVYNRLRQYNQRQEVEDVS